MFGFFKKRAYRIIFIPILQGEDGGIKINFKNYPIRESLDADKIRKEAYADFNTELIYCIYTKIGDVKTFIKTYEKTPATLMLEVGKYQITCRMELQKTFSKKEFMAIMPDAIIAAFKTENIKR